MTSQATTRRKRLRVLGMGLATVLGLGRRGFFIPYRHADAIAPHQPAYPALEALFAAAAPQFRTVLGAIDDHAAALEAIGDAPPPAPRWQQGWFPRLDAAAAYVLVRTHRPARIVEVGSGHSTRFLARAIADDGLATTLTAIDPQPRAAIARLPVRHIGTTLQAAGTDAFAALGPGDMLFVDSSHIAMPGSDVDILFNRVLPMLPAGVLVHVHDICLPDDYPAAWRWRGYNEQLLAAALLIGGGFAPVFASHYVATRMGEAVAGSAAARLPLFPGAVETSLWLRKMIPAVTNKV